MAYNADEKGDAKDHALAEADLGRTATWADEVSAWQCIVNNPKIVLWTLYANSKPCTCHVVSGSATDGDMQPARPSWATRISPCRCASPCPRSSRHLPP